MLNSCRVRQSIRRDEPFSRSIAPQSTEAEGPDGASLRPEVRRLRGVPRLILPPEPRQYTRAVPERTWFGPAPFDGFPGNAPGGGELYDDSRGESVPLVGARGSPRTV